MIIRSGRRAETLVGILLAVALPAACRGHDRSADELRAAARRFCSSRQSDLRRSAEMLRKGADVPLLIPSRDDFRFCLNAHAATDEARDAAMDRLVDAMETYTARHSAAEQAQALEAMAAVYDDVNAWPLL